MPGVLGEYYIELHLMAALEMILLGFIGGILSGFIGSGGAFFMTPGMMNIGVHGPVAVGSNITHKFGKAMMGAKKHSELGHVDKKLGILMVFTSFAGISIAAKIMDWMFQVGGSTKGKDLGAHANLYISLIFVLFLSIVSISMLRDALGKRKDDTAGPSRKIADLLSRLRLSPMITFPVADVRVSLWLILGVGLAVGYMAGTIGVGGFLGVPAMIYVFGVPTAVAAGTELYLAQFMGAWGALNYAFRGFVDIRLTLLLYLGSLVGLYIGAYGTKVVKEVMIRLVTGVVILLCVVSRAIAIPMYLRQLGWVDMPDYDFTFNTASKAMLFVAGIGGAAIILYNVFRAYWQRHRIQASLMLHETSTATAQR